MKPLLSVISIWLSTNFGLPVNAPHPQIMFHPEDSMSQLWYESVTRYEKFSHGALNGDDRNPTIRAFYDDSREIIVLAKSWNPLSAKDVSVLVHEFVHHLQNLDNRKYACRAEREKLAYQAQDEWLMLFGTRLEIEFEIDPLTLLVRTQCMN